MAVVHHCKKQICSLLLILVLTVGFNFEASFGQQCQHSGASTVHESHVHNHHCEHSHGHHHHHHDHDDDYHDLGMKKLPEELAEEEDLRLLEFASPHDHDHDRDHYHGGASELSGVGLWIHAMGCSLLVSLASLICLILLPLIFFQGKPSKALVDSLAVFGVRSFILLLAV